MTITDRRGIVVDASNPVDYADPNPGLAVKAPCRLATTANITLSGLQTIDGVATVEGDRILLKNQTTTTQNGIYNASSGNWTRASDCDANGDLAAGTEVVVVAGATNANTRWQAGGTDPIVIGTSAISWSQVAISAAALAALQADIDAAQAGTVVTVTDQDAVFPNSRQLAVTAPITLTDGGAGGSLTIALTTPLAQAYGGTGATSISTLNNVRLSKTASYTVTNSDKMKTIALSGGGSAAVKTLTFAAGSGYDADFMVMVANEDTRGWKIAPSGGTNFILWPKQTCIVFNQNNTWCFNPIFQRYTKASVIIYVDPVFGSDSNDGLASGAGAFLTIQAAYNSLRLNVDAQASPPTIQLADGTYSVGSGVTMTYDQVGSAQILVTGNNATPANVVVSCDGAGSCFSLRDGGVTVSFGGMTLGTTGNSSALLTASQGAVADPGVGGAVNFNAAPLGTHASATTWASVNFGSSYSIDGNAANHLSCSNGGYINYGSFTVTGAAGLTFSTYVTCSNCGVVSGGGAPMTFSGFAGVTGQRYSVGTNGVIVSNGMTFPGNSAGATSTGGQYV